MQTVAVGGDDAGTKDYTDALRSHAPLVFAFVLTLAFLLLLLTFRSVVIPLKAILLNLLSVGAAYGSLVATFQWGWGESILGFQSTGGITSWVPPFLFVVLFGLSMDYHVFILSRVREAVDSGMKTTDAVAHGIRSTAGVVTSAAIVMVAVFSIFGTLTQVSMKQLGVGLAFAVLLDAMIVRGVLLPTTMTLLGEANWWLPHWLRWLPQLAVEKRPTSAPSPAPTARPLTAQNICHTLATMLYLCRLCHTLVTMLFLDPVDALLQFQQALDAFRTSGWLGSSPSGSRLPISAWARSACR